MNLSAFINKIFSFLDFYRYKRRLNITKTIYVNLRSFPINQAIKLPILIYGKCNILSLKGEFILKGKIRKGVVKIGVSDPLRSLNSSSVIQNFGTIEFGENVVLRRGIVLGAHAGSKISFGDNAYIGDNVSFLSYETIHIGANVRVANNVSFMDSDIHYMVNVDSKEVKNNIKPIIIGNNNWIGSWVSVKKGAVTPDYTIVAGPYTMLSKDYSGIIEPYSIIGGIPAKLISKGLRRVINYDSETLINDHYRNNCSTFYLNDIDLDSFCLPND